MVIDKILSAYHLDSFDFRKYANPDDQLSYLFEDWVTYYRMKHAICKTINPSSILEIGVRYGYSAITFLHAAPNARYLGIDNDTSTFGGSAGAIQWAREITLGYNAEFVIADSQAMDDFPGNCWDMIHIDGQQDGDGTFHDLELALSRARWILVDGYFWTNENMLSTTHFLNKYSQFIEYTLIIPGYAGDLLIKTNPLATPLVHSTPSYLNLRKAYDHDYYMNVCKGSENFKRTRGLLLEDPRLIAAFVLADPKKGKKILDIGSGRGELGFALALSGADVHALDYSPGAFEIARRTYESIEMDGMLTFICADVVTSQFNGEYAVIVATDFIECIEEEALRKVIKKCSDHLISDGRLVLCSSSNKQYYDKKYPILRQKAKESGSFLPANPRSYYEQLMHINEQTPESLESCLSEFFPHVCVWVVNGENNMTGSLTGEYTQDEMDNARCICAVASDMPIGKEDLISLLSQNPLDPNSLKVGIDVLDIPTKMEVNRDYCLQIRISNDGKESFKSLPPYPVHISYHWFDYNGRVVVFDGIRTAIQPPLQSSCSRNVSVFIRTPPIEGSYTLQLTLVQENRFWFEEILPDLPISVVCDVQNNLSEAKSKYVVT